MIFTEEQIKEENLQVFIVEPYKFPKRVMLPIEVDTDKHKVKMKVPIIDLPSEGLIEGSPSFENASPELEEIEGKVEYKVKETLGYVLVLNPEGQVVAESDIDSFEKATKR